MNERIKELALRAGYLPDSFGVGHWDMPECHKFAELLIRECADIALREDHDPYECILKEFGMDRKVSRCDVCDCMYPCSASRSQK